MGVRYDNIVNKRERRGDANTHLDRILNDDDSILPDDWRVTNSVDEIRVYNLLIRRSY